jgi:hypothetical protein
LGSAKLEFIESLQTELGGIDVILRRQVIATHAGL